MNLSNLSKKIILKCLRNRKKRDYNTSNVQKHRRDPPHDQLSSVLSVTNRFHLLRRIQISFRVQTCQTFNGPDWRDPSVQRDHQLPKHSSSYLQRFCLELANRSGPGCRRIEQIRIGHYITHA
jgi:hypothetical protein